MRDIRNKGWFWVENSLIDRDDLNPYEKLLYMTLARYCDNNGKCFPAIETLMKATGINSKATIVKYLKNLEEKELIFVIRCSGKSNTYYLKNAEKKEKEQFISNTSSGDEPVHEMNHTSSPDELLPVHEVNSKETNLKKHNKKTNKEKNKKEKSKNEIHEFINNLTEDNEYKELLFKYIEYRKNIKKPIKTVLPIKKIVKDFPNWFVLDEAINIAMEKEWTGLEPEWIEKHKKSKVFNNNNENKIAESKDTSHLKVDDDYMEQMKARYGL